jgi:uncharacterized protein (TIGR02284 family)
VDQNNKYNTPRPDATDANRDPITGAPGAHPVGSGVGASIGGTIGAVVGSPAGPAGVVAGAALGGVVGGLVGKGAAEAVNPTTELEYWRGAFPSRPYATGRRYEDFEPVYLTTIDTYNASPGRSFDDVEPSIKGAWERRRGMATLQWENVREASRDSWDRLMRLAGRRDTQPLAASEAEAKAADDANDVLKELQNSVTGYKSAAEKIENHTYRTALRQLASERERAVAELKPLIESRGKDAAESGSVMGALHRSWMALSSALGGGDHAIISACERSEDSVVKAYEDALDGETLTPPLRDVITRQYVQAKRAHDLVRAWRDQFQTARH